MAQLNLKISQRGFLLVSIPLLFQIVFVSVLIFLLTQVETEIHREAHAKDVVRCVYKLQRDMLDCATAAGAFSLTGDPYSDERFPLAYNWTKQDLAELYTLIGSDPLYTRKLRNIHMVTDRGLKLFEELKDRHAEAMTLRSLVGTGGFYARTASLVGQLGGATRDIIEQEELILKQSPVMQLQQRQLLQKALAVGVGLNVILAIGMAMFFSKSITKRLEVMTENSLRVTKGEPLNNPVEGADEIAQLDQTFHKMVDDLKIAEQRKQEILQTVSHDLRSPLSSVQGILTLLSVGAMGSLPERALDKVRLAESDVERLIKLINDLLDFEKIGDGSGKLVLAPISVKRLVDRAVNSISVLAEARGINISRTVDQVEVLGDEERLIQVIVNLVANAIKFSPENSEIEVDAATVEHDDGACFIEISVADQGRGVPLEMREKIFERFEQVRKTDATESGGAGLGLAICKSIVELHDGFIGVRENDGGGSVFWIRIPAVGTV